MLCPNGCRSARWRRRPVSRCGLCNGPSSGHTTRRPLPMCSICVLSARHDLEAGVLGDTVFAIVRRWGFTSPGGAFRDGCLAAYRERPSDTLKRARASQMTMPRPSLPVVADYVVCRECGRRMRSLRKYLVSAHTLTADLARLSANDQTRQRTARGHPQRGQQQPGHCAGLRIVNRKCNAGYRLPRDS